MEELDKDIEIWEAVSPTGQYLNSSVLSLTILGVLEFQVPFDDSHAISLLNHLFLPINPRFSSVMVGEGNGAKKWKRVEVNLNEHVHYPKFPSGMSPEFYEECLYSYLSKIGMDQLPQNRPLWAVHIFKYPTSNSAGSFIFHLHHALGDGYSFIGALLSCLQRADNPSLPLTFPSRQSISTSSSSKPQDQSNNNIIRRILKRVPQVSSWIADTVVDFGWSILKSSIIKDDESPIRSASDGVEFRPMAMTTMSFSLGHIKQIKTNLNVTINDVITGVILLGTRLYMEGEGENWNKSKSTALVLLNTRNVGGYTSVGEMVKPKATMPWGNHFAFLHVAIPKLPTSSSDFLNPLDFVFKAQKIIKRKRNSSAVFLTGGLLDKIRQLRGPEATSKYIYNTIKNSSMGITNLIGPVEQMSLANQPIAGLFFCVAGAPQSLEVTVISYMGNLRILFGVEKDFIDPQKLKSCVGNAFDMIFQSSCG